jgi:hypothetical protein
MELLEKITPKFSKDIVGNKLAVKNFTDILKNSKYCPKVIALVGPIGCGKIIICSLLFKELNFKVYNVSTKETLQIASSFIVNKSIDSYVSNPRPKILFLDNIEILLATDRNTMTLIDSCIPDLIRNNVFLVITSKLSEEKALTTAFKKSIEVIKLSYPTIKDSFVYLSTVLEDQDDEKLLAIVKAHRGNIRDSVLHLNQTMMEREMMVNERCYSEYNNFEIIQSFMSNPSWNSVEVILENDPSMISYLLYENILDEVYNNREANATLKTFSKINNYLVQANILEKYMQESLNWNLYNVIQVIKIGGMYISIKDLKVKQTKKDTKYRFSQVLSKLSHRNIMNKKMSNIAIPNIDLINLIDISAIQLTDDSKQITTTYHKYFV